MTLGTEEEGKSVHTHESQRIQMLGIFMGLFENITPDSGSYSL